MADFYKYHGLGNDYIVIDPSCSRVKMTEHNIKLICDRNFGIGSDGILYGPIPDKGGIYFKIFNPDGSEAEKSGNGLRIFALYVIDKSYVKSDEFILLTKGGKVDVKLLDSINNTIKLNIGKYSFLSADIPAKIEKEEALGIKINILGNMEEINCVNLGNPHCVLIKNKVNKELAKKLGPKLENHDIFPNRINVQFVEVLDENNIKIEIWERGAGYTLASGTSSSAAACVAHKLGLIKNNVSVHMPGGNVDVDIHNENVFLTGNVSRVAEGDFSKDFKNLLKI
ncbi:MAG: diaminopimelate epimerase [Candidatus Midichloriaceae bacterium]|jgi:diaminopimelate epimerase